ncbi:hypothetical protein ASF24_03515 [Methylobacterium sp. Leaf86]|uniref:hypothetical protein n=1 Tax=Methylobacterium sp. Leaf86 TaxID=1736242 RepID=UPI0006FDE333|nr:hypothetical protein [Methylobacterium sp. Leaf86]KQO61019.1 hypothetical protein ASF24_03515 [Methylobacterium sp. Leaf86]
MSLIESSIGESLQSSDKSQNERFGPAKQTLAGQNRKLFDHSCATFLQVNKRLEPMATVGLAGFGRLEIKVLPALAGHALARVQSLNLGLLILARTTRFQALGGLSRGTPILAEWQVGGRRHSCQRSFGTDMDRLDRSRFLPRTDRLILSTGRSAAWPQSASWIDEAILVWRHSLGVLKRASNTGMA